MMKKTILFLLATTYGFSCFASVEQPTYTDEQKSETVQKLRESGNSYRQNIRNQMSDYDKEMLRLTEQRLGGYKQGDLGVDDNNGEGKIDFSKMSDAEKESIRITRRNNKMVHDAMQGL